MNNQNQAIEFEIAKIIPPKGIDAELSKCKDIFKDYYKSFNYSKGLYIFGNPGVGKTWSIYAIIKEIMRNSGELFIKDVFEDKKYIPQKNAIITSMAKIYEDLTVGQFNKEFNSAEYKNKLRHTDILMIDDFGMEKVSDYRQEILEDIINTRYENQEITFFTSNYDLDQLMYRIGGDIAGRRIVSRIIEMCDIIELHGEDKRLK